MNFFQFIPNQEDLLNTPLENVFINHYMPNAPGDFVKVYILGLKYALSYYENTLSNEVIARTLNMSQDEVLKAWKYWEIQGIVKLNAQPHDESRIDYCIEFYSLKEMMLNIKKKDNDSNDKYSPQRIINARSNYRVKEMFEYVRRLMGREPSQNEIFTILDWIDDYSFPPDVIIMIIEDCFSRNKKDWPYIKQVAKNWFDANINTVEKAVEYSTKHKEKWQKYSKVLSFLRLGRQPTAQEEELLHKWFYNFNFSVEIVLKACERTAHTIKPSFAYLDKILCEWNNLNLNTLQEIEAYILKTDNKPNKVINKQSNSSKPSFNNFANRTYDTKLLKENLLKKSRGELSE